MANQDAADLKIQTPIATSYGNLAIATSKISLAAAANGDVFRFLKLPPDCRLVDLQVIVPGGSSASTTMKFGYAPTDGSAGDDDCFMAAKAIASATRLRADAAVEPPVVDKEHHIIGTLGGAAIATATDIIVVAHYEFLGD